MHTEQFDSDCYLEVLNKLKKNKKNRWPLKLPVLIIVWSTEV